MSNQPVYAHLSSKEDEEGTFVIGDDVTNQTMMEGLIDHPFVKEVPNIYVGQMVAPAKLPEGYELPVKLGMSQFNVQIPMGGVEEGQVFTVSIPQDKITIPPSSKLSGQNSTSILPPVGVWRDNLCDCFSYGMCHPHCVTSTFCPLLGAGQVINRLQLTLTSVPSNTEAGSARAFAITFYITIILWALYVVVELCILAFIPFSDYQYYQIPKPEGNLAAFIQMYNILKWVFVLLTLVVVTLLRRAVRGKYKIPGNCLADCCCAFWCRCCVVGQMLRHTTDYDVYPSRVCSPTGLSSKGSPMIV